MGTRFAELQNFFSQSGPLQVTSQIGGDLSSSFSLVVSGMQQVGEGQIALLSNAGEIILNEEEIYKLCPSGSGYTLVMDGGTELRFTPAQAALSQPLF